MKKKKIFLQALHFLKLWCLNTIKNLLSIVKLKLYEGSKVDLWERDCNCHVRKWICSSRKKKNQCIIDYLHFLRRISTLKRKWFKDLYVLLISIISVDQFFYDFIIFLLKWNVITWFYPITSDGIFFIIYLITSIKYIDITKNFCSGFVFTSKLIFLQFDNFSSSYFELFTCMWFVY